MGSKYYGPIQASDNARLHLGDNHFYEAAEQLKYVPGALYDAYGLEHTACHPATRRELLEKIKTWAEHPTSPSIFWLSGMAGTGKSTISYTIAERLDQDTSCHAKLGASFFFKRGEGDRGSAALLFPTLVRQLTQKVPNLKPLVVQAISTNPDVCTKSLGEQFRTLIRRPLQQFVPSSDQPVYVIVLDALDECKTAEIDVVLRLWSEVPRLKTIELRLFVTSRPELPVQLGFKKNISNHAHPSAILHEVPRPIIEHDILAYLRDTFAAIREDSSSRPLCVQPLREDWPGEKVLRDLTQMAVPLFIIAATICRFVRKTRRDPQERLATMLTSRRLGHMPNMMQIYLPVLEQIVASSADETDADDEEQLYLEFRMIVGSISTLAEPLSRRALANLLHLPAETVAFHLEPLYSVLQIPDALDAPVRPLHLSFSEFLTSPEISDRPFAVNSAAAHAMLFAKCIELLSRPDSKGLRENMCDLAYPGQPRRDLSHAQVTAHLSAEMQYACRYWTFHAQQSGMGDDGLLYTFLTQHFLHWLEALSLMDCLANALDYVGMLQSVFDDPSTQDESVVHLTAFLADARRFILANRYICEEAPLQIYSSAIIFSPQKSIVRQLCGKTPSWCQREPTTSEAWSAELQKLEGHTDNIEALAFSPDGSQLASGSWDDTIRLWDTKTGQEIQKLEKHSHWVLAVMFCPDGSQLASASAEHTIQLWDTKTGQEVQMLEGHIGWVNAVAYSPDGSQLASGSSDQTIRLWDTKMGKEVQKLEGHTKEVWAVAFSPDGSQLASGSSDQTVRLWDAKTGREIQKLEGHTEGVKAVAFSPDGSQLASGSNDRAVRLWDVNMWQEVHMLEGHSEEVLGVAFSPDSSHLASASRDQTVRLWDTKTGKEVQKLEGHTKAVRAVAFSPDGSQLASASDDQTVRLWDANTRQNIQKPEGHTAWVNAVVFSPDGSQLASASRDRTIRLWDPKTGKEVQKLEGHTKGVWAVAFSPDGSQLASVSYDRTVRLWNAKMGHEAQKLEGHTDGVWTMVFSPDGSQLASASRDQTVRLWDANTGQEVQKLEGHTGWVNAVAYSPDGSQLASASNDRTVRLWDAKTGREIQKLEGHTDEVWAVAFSPDGSQLASASCDSTVRLWDANTGQEIQKLEGHTNWVRTVAFSPDGSQLASASSLDQTVRLWNASTGHQERVLKNYQHVYNIGFTDNGQSLLTNRGTIEISSEPTASKRCACGTGAHFVLKDDWIEYGSRRVLWLPHDYRSAVSAVYDDILAVGHRSGLLNFLQITQP